VSRFTAGANLDEIAKAHQNDVWFGTFELDSGTYRYCTWNNTISFGGNDYTALGDIVEITPIRENADGIPEGVEVLIGVNNELVLDVLSENYTNRSMSLHFGMLDSNYQLVATPKLMGEYRMDPPIINTGQGSSVIRIRGESRLIIWNKAPGWKYTHEDHVTLMGSGDNFFDQLHQMIGQVLKWGNVAVRTAVPGTGSFGPPEPRRRPV